MIFFNRALRIAAIISLGSCRLAPQPQDKNDLMLSEKSSLKCGILEENQEGSYLKTDDHTRVAIKPIDDLITKKLKSLNQKEVCIISDFSEKPVRLTFEHLIQPKNQTLCGIITKTNDDFYFKPKEDLITYELSATNESVSAAFQAHLDKSICLIADFRGQEVKITSSNQFTETEP
ncbi:MAG: hypothetical protein WCI18_15810 [Pseudomonadota bacterium]